MSAPVPPFREDRAAWTAFLVLLVLQVGAMLGAFLPVPHTGGDNAGYLGLAHSLLERGAYLDLYLPGEPIHTKYPPGFPLLLAGVRLLGGGSWVAFKAAVAVTATLAVVFTFFWARARRGTLFGAVVAGLLAVSSAVVYYSHWILSDVPFLALTFLALWALRRAGAAPGGAGGAPGDGLRTADGAGWLVLGCAAALAAYFTRSAGLPLVLAAAGGMALGRRWKSLAAFGVAFALPAVLWWLRNRGAPDTYLAEFWLVDPYQPGLGRVGLAGLAGRAVANAWGYLTGHVPGGLTGLEGPPALALGLVLGALALWGWIGSVRKGRAGIGPAEIFFPLYAGLILLWPEVWSGDRFALPLLPLVLFYGGTALLELSRRIHPRATLPAGIAGVLLVGGPALFSWAGEARTASACMGLARGQGPWACAGPAMAEFADAAAWSGANLPDGSVVISRKPRFFFLLSGLKSQMFPLSREPEEFFSEARDLGARYVLLDRLDGLAGFYVGGVIRSEPGAFCGVTAVGSGSGGGSQLLGVEPGGAEAVPPAGDGSVRLRPCPPGWTRPAPEGTGEAYAPASSSSIPLFGRSTS